MDNYTAPKSISIVLFEKEAIEIKDSQIGFREMRLVFRVDVYFNSQQAQVL